MTIHVHLPPKRAAVNRTALIWQCTVMIEMAMPKMVINPLPM